MSLATVLVVEDDSAIRQGLRDALDFAGYSVLEAPDGRAGLETATSAQIDLVLLDVLMPGMDGFSVLTRIRESKPTLPVIMLTARGEEEDRIRGLRSGADDYVVKPFSASELIARVEAVLRRSPERPLSVPRLDIGGRTIDFERRELTRSDGTRLPIPQREAELLRYLAEHAGRAVSRDELLRSVWGLDPRGVETRTVDMAVARLREHLDDDPSSPSVVVTVRGKGYMLAASDVAPTPGDEPP